MNIWSENIIILNLQKCLNKYIFFKEEMLEKKIYKKKKKKKKKKKRFQDYKLLQKL